MFDIYLVLLHLPAVTKLLRYDFHEKKKNVGFCVVLIKTIFTILSVFANKISDGLI